MKKLIPIILNIVTAFSLLMPVQAKKDDSALPDDNKIRLVNVTEDGHYEIIKENDSYAAAKVSHTLLQHQYENLGIAKGQTFLSIENGVVEFKKAQDCSVNITYTNAANQEEGYTNGCYGADGAFLEYNDGNGMVKFQLSGVIGSTSIENVTIHPLTTLPNVSHFEVHNGILLHYLKSDIASKGYDNVLHLGQAPSYLKEKTIYYSYDSHYFYKSFSAMITDVRKSIHTQAVNAKQPYYNYYQYVNHRSTTAYSYEDVHAYLQNTRLLKQSITKFEGTYLHDILTQSMIVQGEKGFFQYQNQFGANALMMLSLALNESASGRSALSYNRNNLFGHAAYDSDVEKNASRYLRVSDSIYAHAAHYISSSYLNPNQFQYHGGHFGNKAGGMNVSYASDPYWGEKAAQYYYDIDHALQDKDLNQYAIGITGTKKVNVRKDPKEAAKTLYAIPKGTQASLLLLDKQTEGNAVWYLVQTDVPLTNDRNVSANPTYNYRKSYGYVKASELSFITNEKHLNEKNYVDVSFDANGGTFYPGSHTITMQIESGKIPIILEPEKKNALFIGWDKEIKKAEKDIVYKANYRSVKNIAFIERPKQTYQQHDYLDVSKGKIQVSFEDGSTQERSLTTDMVSGYDPTTLGTQTLTIRYAGKTLSYEIHVKKQSESTGSKLQEKAAYIIKTYSDKVGLTDDALTELEKFQNDVLQESNNPLDDDVLRAVDRILQPNLKPRLSVLIHDDTYDLQISGLSLAMQKKTSFLNAWMPKTVVVNVHDSIDNEEETLFKKVAEANYVTYEAGFTIDGKEDMSGYDPETQVLYSIKKPKNSKGKLYRILTVDGENIRQLPTTQSDTRILFQAKKGSFAIVSIQGAAPKGSMDFTEVATIKGNGKNYITTYILIPFAVIFLILILVIVLLLIRRKNKIAYRKKKRAIYKNQ